MTRIRCPQDRCIFWEDGWCDSDEIELHPTTLACITFEEVELDPPAAISVDDNELEWEEDEPIFEEDLDESLYGVDIDDDDEEDYEEYEESSNDAWTL